MSDYYNDYYSVNKEKYKIVTPIFTASELLHRLHEDRFCILQPTHHNQVPVIITGHVFTKDEEKLILRCTSILNTNFSISYSKLLEQAGHLFSIYDHPYEVIKHLQETLPKRLNEVSVLLNVIS